MRDTVEHVFFDLDRTLWDFETNSKAALHEILSTHRIPDITGADPESFIELYTGINDRYWELYRNGTVTQPQLRRGRFLETLAHFGCTDVALADALGADYVAISPRKTALVEGAIDLLDHLCGDYTLHIITNGFEEVQHIKLRESGIRGYFNEVITSERAGVKKPDARIFRFAERVASAVPERSVMIGDHLEADVMGATSCGWHAIHFSPEGAESGSHHHVRSLDQVRQLL